MAAAPVNGRENHEADHAQRRHEHCGKAWGGYPHARHRFFLPGCHAGNKDHRNKGLVFEIFLPLSFSLFNHL